MKNFTKAIALCMALLMILTCPIGASAAEVADATIDFEQKGSLTIYKIDLTNAEKDGIWDSSYHHHRTLWPRNLENVYGLRAAPGG